MTRSTGRRAPARMRPQPPASRQLAGAVTTCWRGWLEIWGWGLNRGSAKTGRRNRSAERTRKRIRALKGSAKTGSYSEKTQKRNMPSSSCPRNLCPPHRARMNDAFGKPVLGGSEGHHLHAPSRPRHHHQQLSLMQCSKCALQATCSRVLHNHPTCRLHNQSQPKVPSISIRWCTVTVRV